MRPFFFGSEIFASDSKGEPMNERIVPMIHAPD